MYKYFMCSDILTCLTRIRVFYCVGTETWGRQLLCLHVGLLHSSAITRQPGEFSFLRNNGVGKNKVLWQTEIGRIAASLTLMKHYLPLHSKKTKKKTKLHGLSPRANYTDRATAAGRRSDCQLVRIEGATWSA
jgi:hypothetical protein